MCALSEGVGEGGRLHTSSYSRHILSQCCVRGYGLRVFNDVC